jgi:hypothetical protein
MGHKALPSIHQLDLFTMRSFKFSGGIPAIWDSAGINTTLARPWQRGQGQDEAYNWSYHITSLALSNQ